MRELEFRVWDYQHNEMMYENPCRLWIQRDGTLNFGKTFGREYKPEEFDWKTYDNLRFEVQQFTGLKDKNDRKIYEGDIVSFKYQEENGFINETIGTVVFDVESSAYVLDNPEFKWENAPDIPITFLGFYQKWQVEVLGNKFEGFHGEKQITK